MSRRLHADLELALLGDGATLYRLRVLRGCAAITRLCNWYSIRIGYCPPPVALLRAYCT